jgi:hypothetical protein
MVFIDNLGHQLISVDNTYTVCISNNHVHDLMTWPRQMLTSPWRPLCLDHPA